MSFCNSTIKPVRKDKPHIVFIDKFWRVSKMPKSGLVVGSQYKKWLYAHSFVQHLNDGLNYPWGRDV